MDINCAVCGEPWDIWGANHGDMAAWEYDLFKKGAGCPCCEGKNKTDNTEQHMLSVLMNSDDPDSFGLMAGEDRVKWVEPEPKVLWECHHCKVKMVISNECPYDGDNLPNDVDDYLQWYGGEKLHYENGCGPYTYGKLCRVKSPLMESEHTLEGKTYCPGCAASCAECGETILIGDAVYNLDSYDPGASFPHPSNPFWGVVCLECYQEESTCKECGEWMDDCCCDD